MKWFAMFGVFLFVGCSGASHERLEQVRMERELVRRQLVVCSMTFRSDLDHCERRYGARLKELTCEEADLQGRTCKEALQDEKE